MSDRLFAVCCLGTDHQHATWEPCPNDWQKRQAAECSCRGSDDMCPCQNVDRSQRRSEAADEITHLKALIDELAGGLEPFAALAVEDSLDAEMPLMAFVMNERNSADSVIWRWTAGQFRNARALISKARSSGKAGSDA